VSVPVPLAEAATDSALLLRVVASPDVDRATNDIRVAAAMTIGRELACDVVLNEKTVSRRHARIEPAPEGLRLTDLGSSNGIWMGAERIQQATLVNGDRFRIGSTVFECVCGAEASPPAAEQPVAVSAPFVAAALQATVREGSPPAPFVIRIVEGTRAGTEVVIPDGIATIGRAKDCTIVFESRDISRRHATIQWTPDGYLITDTNSTAGMWMGSRQVMSYVLKPNERIRLGDSVVLECAPDSDASVPRPDATSVPQAGAPAPSEPADASVGATSAEAAQGVDVALDVAKGDAPHNPDATMLVAIDKRANG
jgi:pSer/pThr/pTyr-binding forkhead associated (FHA) protein